MRFSKFAAVACTFALAAPVTRAADIVDNPDQAAARAALVAKLFDMSAASTPTNNVQPAPKTTAPVVAAPVVTAPAVAPPAFSTTTVVKPAVKAEATVMHPVHPTEPAVYAPLPRADTGPNFRIHRSPRMDIQNPPMNWTRTETPKVAAPVVKMSPPPQAIVKPVAPKAVAPAPAPVITTTTVVKPAVKVEPVVRPVYQSEPVVSAPLPRADKGGNFRVLRSPRMDIQNPPVNWTKTEAPQVAAPAIKMSPPAQTTAKPGAPDKVVAAPVTKTTKPTVKPMPTPVVKTAVKPLPTPVVKPVNSDFAPIVAPPSPLDASKQQKLLDLLNKYKADQISPEQYHLERSRIISGF